MLRFTGHCWQICSIYKVNKTDSSVLHYACWVRHFVVQFLKIDWTSIASLCVLCLCVAFMWVSVCLFPPEVGDVVGVADSTIRQSYRLLYPQRDQLFPKDFAFSTPLESLPKHWQYYNHITIILFVPWFIGWQYQNGADVWLLYTIDISIKLFWFQSVLLWFNNFSSATC